MDDGKLKEIREIYEKAEKYEYMRERWDGLISDLQAVVDKYNPKVNIKLKYSGDKVNYSEIVDDMVRLMQGGSEISRDLIQKTYPHLSFNSVQYIFKIIGNMPNVDKRRDGVKVFYFMRVSK